MEKSGSLPLLFLLSCSVPENQRRITTRSAPPSLRATKGSSEHRPHPQVPADAIGKERFSGLPPPPRCRHVLKRSSPSSACAHAVASVRLPLMLLASDRARSSSPQYEQVAGLPSLPRPASLLPPCPKAGIPEQQLPSGPSLRL
ncbi:hypothetical protein ZWY2020_040604 [Hordeum vulgare]|nr:hypothetical protein ZWY2020_040604 [Hordeum vulgare]